MSGAETGGSRHPHYHAEIATVTTAAGRPTSPPAAAELEPLTDKILTAASQAFFTLQHGSGVSVLGVAGDFLV